MSLDSRNEELERKLSKTQLPDAVATLMDDAKKSRRRVRLLTASIILDFVLTIGLTVVSAKTADLTRQAQSNKAALIQNCETANDSRNKQLTLWGYVLALNPEQARTPEQQAAVDKFAKFVEDTFAPRDCEAEANKSIE